MGLTLVLGGVRSGKSAWAEALAAASGRPVRYVGTADPSDPSMATRLRAHRARRPGEWESLDAGDDLAACVHAGGVTLIDGLGGWIAGRDRDTVERAVDGLIAAAVTATVIIVAEVAGEGLLPLDRIAREWLDQLGEATQRLSARAERAVLLTAGRALELPAPEPPRWPR